MRLGIESDGRRDAGARQAGRYASLAAIVLAWMLGGRAAIAQTGPFGYVSDENGNVSVLDLSTDSVAVGAITEANPRGIAVRGDGSAVYIADYGSGVSVVNPVTNSVVATVAAGSGVGIVINPTGTAVYETNGNVVSVINTATNTISQNITVGTQPWGIGITPDGRFLYVANSGDNTVSVISTTSNTVVQTINVASTPQNIVMSPDGTKVYVNSNNTGNITVINTATNTLATSINIAGTTIFGLTVSADGTRLYAANSSGNTVSIINTATDAIIGTIAVGSQPSGVFLSPDGTRLFVTNFADNTISVVNTATNAVIDTVAAGGLPEYPAICSNGNALLASGSTFKANTSGALACTLASGVSGPVFTGGTMQFAGANITSSLAITLMSQGGNFDTDGNHATLSGTISGPGGLTKIGLGTLTLSGSGTYAGPTAVNVGTLQAGAANVFSPNSAYTVASGATLDLNGFSQSIGSLAGRGSVTLGSGTLTTGNDGTSTTFSGSISGTGGLTKIGLGRLTLSGSGAYSGPTGVNIGTLQAGAANVFSPNSAYAVASGATLDLNGFSQSIGSLAGRGSVTLGSGTLTAGNDGTSTTFSGGISGTGGLTKIGAGTLILTGTNSYGGATTINGGTLEVDGSINNSSSVSVNAGGMLTGTGIVDPLTVTVASAGILAPGNGTPGSSITIAGNLAFQSGAIYQVQVNPSTASFANVTGTATLGGATVNAVFANGSYISKTYTILTATGGVSGTFAPTVANTNLPANFHTSLSYDANDAYLDLSLNYAALNFGSGLNGNQQAVANALVNSFNANGGIPLVYGALNGAGLTQASGELGTSSQQTTFNAMGQFMGLLTDPFMQRNGGAGMAPGAPGFAEEAANAYAARKRSDAFAMFTKAPPAPFAQRWSVWAAGFGGSQSTDGNVVTGSNNTTSNVYGTAVGADYLFSPNTLAGFALAGGGTSFSVNGLGSGRSDLFQAGAYVRHTNGPAYISAALSYGWQDITTDRIVTAAGIDHLRAEFNANAWSGRMEGGYRFVAPWGGGIGLTPYVAAQFTTFDLPAYAEQVISGASTFALSYGAHSPTDTRSDLGLRTDKSFALQDAVLTLRGRLAWAHDFDPDRSIAATFQALPGASFVVNGAAQAANSALTTASAELKWMNGWSAATTFEGEFSGVTRSYAAKGVVRYAW